MLFGRIVTFGFDRRKYSPNAGVVVVTDIGTLQNERSIGQHARAGNAGVQGIGRKARKAGRQYGIGVRIEIGTRIQHRKSCQEGRDERRACRTLRHWRPIGIRLRHLAGIVIRALCLGRSADIERLLRRYRELLAQRKVRARRAVLVDDALGEQI